MIATAFAAFVFTQSLAAQGNPNAAATGGVVAAGRTQADPMPFHFSAGLTNSLGSGTFVINPNNPTLSSTLSLQPMWILSSLNVNLIINQRVGIEWTQGDTDTYTRQLSLADTAFRASYTGFRFPDLGLGIIVGGGYNLPLSLASRGVGSVGSLAASGRLMWNSDFGLGLYGNLALGANLLVPQLAGRLGTQPGKTYQDRSLGAVQPVTCNPRSESEIASYACQDGGIPSLATWSPGVGINYTTLDGQLTFGWDLAFRQSFSPYVGPDDAFTADKARTGIVPRQSTSSNIGVYYSPLSWFTLSVGAWSGQPVFAEDGVTPRFPVWDFVSPYNNFSSLYVDTTFSI